jgi:hypothetical protein
MMAVALAKGWNVSTEQKAKCLRVAELIIDDKHATHFHKLAAIKVMALVDGIDAKREATEVRAATPPTTINIFGDVSAYAGVFGEPITPNPNENALLASEQPIDAIAPVQPDRSQPIPPQP